MFKRTALTALTVLAASAGTAQAGGIQTNDQLGTWQVDTTQYAAAIQAKMPALTSGWSFAIAQDGLLKKTGKGGFALSAKDNGGSQVGMLPTQRIELASVTKNFTAVATMKLLRGKGISINASIDPYLPPGWTRGPGFKTKSVTFRHLLSHTSGLSQALNAMPESTRPKNNGWADMKVAVENGTVPGSQRAYKNANYALLRILNAELWVRSGGQKYVTEEYEVYNTHGIEIGTKTVETPVPVDATTSATYALDALRKKVFEPAGLNGISCSSVDPKNEPKMYPVNATQNSVGSVGNSNADECAGARGIRMSAVQLVQYLAHLRHGDIIHPDDLATMDANQLGWEEDSNGGDGGQFNAPANGKPDNWKSPGVNWHGGDLLGDNELHTCAMTFPDGTEAAMLVNSEMTSTSPCGVLLDTWTELR